MTAGVTLVVMVAISIRATATLRLWAAAIGLVVGSLVGGLFFGIYDSERVLDAAWVGLPPAAWPGIDLSLGPDFWALLPAFVILTFVGALDTIGDTIAIQRISWRKPRAIDFQSIQGALAADGLGNLLSGLMGTVPNTTYAHSIAVVDITRVAARVVGVCVGILYVVLGFLPKLVALVVAIPGPVVAAYFIVLIAFLFMLGGQGARARGSGPSQDGRGGGPRLLVGRGLPTRLDLPRVLPGRMERAARERDDGGRPDRDHPDAVRGADRGRGGGT